MTRFRLCFMHGRRQPPAACGGRPHVKIVGIRRKFPKNALPAASPHPPQGEGLTVRIRRGAVWLLGLCCGSARRSRAAVGCGQPTLPKVLCRVGGLPRGFAPRNDRRFFQHAAKRQSAAMRTMPVSFPVVNDCIPSHSKIQPKNLPLRDFAGDFPLLFSPVGGIIKIERI